MGALSRLVDKRQHSSPLAKQKQLGHHFKEYQRHDSPPYLALKIRTKVFIFDLVITNILRDQCTRKYHLWALWVELEPACDSAEAHRPTHILVA